MKTIDLSELGKFDGGRISAALDQLLRQAVMDCMDRPGVKTARKVTMQLALAPVPDETGDVDHCDMDLQLKLNIPERKKSYSVGVKKNGQIYYNPDSADNVNQGTLLPDADEEAQAAREALKEARSQTGAER